MEAGSKAGPVGEERPNRVKKPNPRFIGPSMETGKGGGEDTERTEERPAASRGVGRELRAR